MEIVFWDTLGCFSVMSYSWVRIKIGSADHLHHQVSKMS